MSHFMTLTDIAGSLQKVFPFKCSDFKHMKLQNDAGFNFWPGVSECMGQGDAKGEVKHGNLIGWYLSLVNGNSVP